MFMMHYTGMLRPKGVPFWALCVGKGSLFHAGGKGKRYLFRKRYVKGCRTLKFSMWKGGGFRNFVCERVPAFQSLVFEDILKICFFTMLSF